ncbi:MAG: hypothetical protein FJ100_03495 [Deltaproteobacteria bacterium]|nr:hypothetical protein [Deltaproteobacteria bacterium]
MSNSTVALGVVVACAALAGAFFVGRALATGAPTQSPLVFSGIVTDAAGVPYKAAQEVIVKFYDKADAPTPKCTAPAVQAEANSGRFAVVLPPDCAQAVHDTPDLWSETVVAKTALPRVHIGAVPYALQADVAKIAAGVQCQGCVKVAALKFDQTVDLAGNTLTTGPGGAVLAAGKLDLGGGAALTAAQVKTLVGGGNADALHTHAGSGGGGGQVIKFKGVTSTTHLGNVGLSALNKACANEFGAARLCTTSELDGMYPAPVAPAKAWIHVYSDTKQSYQTKFGMEFVNGQANCSAQVTSKPFVSSAGGAYGIALETSGDYGSAQCNTLLPATCCGP